MNDIGIIKLIGKYKGFTIVDNDIFQELNQYKWRKQSNGYIVRSIVKNGSWSSEYLHKRILVVDEPNLEIDHINGCRFDNTSRNLRICTINQNQHNRKKQKKETSSKYKGVNWNKQNKKWRSQIAIGMKKIYLGYFDNEKDAALTYNKAAKKYHGDFALLNIIED